MSKGLRVLVTGGTAGIGRGIAQVFAANGARVVIAGRRESRLLQAEEELQREGLDVVGVLADVSNRQSCDAMVSQAVEHLGGLDVLCANAGVYPESPLEQMTEGEIDTMAGINVKGMVFSIQASLDALSKSDRGRIVVTSSITGSVVGYPGLSHYGASKAAQVGFVRSAALELADRGITINAVLPGSIETEGLDGLGADAIAQMRRAIPLNRLGAVEDIGHAAYYFASVGAGFVTGQSLIVDGGQTLPEVLVG